MVSEEKLRALLDQFSDDTYDLYDTYAEGLEHYINKFVEECKRP